jgi:hypothetical protein
MNEMTTRKKGRKAEANIILQANRAAAVGRLMLGEFSDWIEFLEADTMDLQQLPRRQLKSGAADVKKKISKEIKRFCSRNFETMTEAKLSLLYEAVKAHRGIEIALKDFEQTYTKIKPSVLKGYPSHSTVVISLWGLQFKFPEDHLSKDVCAALSTAMESQKEFEKYRKASHRKILAKRDDISNITRNIGYASRSCLLGCFNLVEAYLNGIAWDFSQDESAFNELSNRQQKLLRDIGQTNLRNKIIKYPKIVTGSYLWDELDDIPSAFLDIYKPFRDSLVHPSPFSAPEKFGGYDKISNFYRIDTSIALMAAKITTLLISKIHQHLTDSDKGHPIWLKELMDLLDEMIEFTVDGKRI